MPVVAIVAGVTIRLYYADHELTHFHAVAGDPEMLVRIADLEVMAGTLPPAQRWAVLEWAADPQDNLALAWVDRRTDYGETRTISLGSIRELVAVVVHTNRNGKPRIISAQLANRRERRLYDEHYG